MKIVAAVIVLFISSVAQQSFGYDEKGPWTKVKQIYSKAGDGAPFVYFHAGGMPGCYGNNGAYLPILGEDRSNKIHSVILAALMADRELQVYYNYTGNAEGWGMCQIEAVYIR